MTTEQGAPCPSCGTWIATDSLRCICGFRRRREAITGVLSSLLACGLAVALWAAVYAAAALCLVPLFIIALVAGVYGARCGWIAVQGRGLDWALGSIALALCVVFFSAPVVAIVVSRLLH